MPQSPTQGILFLHTTTLTKLHSHSTMALFPCLRKKSDHLCMLGICLEILSSSLPLHDTHMDTDWIYKPPILSISSIQFCLKTHVHDLTMSLRSTDMDTGHDMDNDTPTHHIILKKII